MVFRNNSSKGIFGEIMSDSRKLKLSGDSRWLQKVALNWVKDDLIMNIVRLVWSTTFDPGLSNNRINSSTPFAERRVNVSVNPSPAGSDARIDRPAESPYVTSRLLWSRKRFETYLPAQRWIRFACEKLDKKRPITVRYFVVVRIRAWLAFQRNPVWSR